MTGDTNPIAQGDAEYHLELLLDMAEDLFQRYAYLALWRIRRWDYEGFTDDYFHWPYAIELRDVSFLEELVWVLNEAGHEKFVDAYESHLRQACRPVVLMLSEPEEAILTVAVFNDLRDDVSVSATQIQTMIEERLLKTIMKIAYDSDMEGIRENWTSYQLAFNTPEEEDA